jgi:putative ABC transport system ATP-binding protein
MEIAGEANAFARAEAELVAVGLGARVHHYPAQMSGGEQQRVALARAAAPRPAILLADEPTGNLDSTNGAAIMDLIFELRDRHGATLVLVTHAPELAARCDRVIRLVDGRIDGALA